MQDQRKLLNVGIVGADPLRLLGLQAILEVNPKILVLPLSADGTSAPSTLSALFLDASTVVDLRGALGEWRRARPHLPVIVLGNSIELDHIQAVIASGAKGYLAGVASEAEILMALEVVLDGSIWAPRKVLAKLLQTSAAIPNRNVVAVRVEHQMTLREAEVLSLLLAGQSNRHIAASMNIDLVTVKAHLGRMFRKAGVKNRVELTAVVHSQRGS